MPKVSSLKWEEIYTAAMEKAKGGLLRAVSFVDEYKGKQIPAGKKSVTMRLVIGSLEKTLKADEIEACVAVVVKKLTKKLGAETR